MALKTTFTALLGGFLLLAPVSNASAVDERCKGPCPANADCICAEGDVPLVLIDGKWSKAVVNQSTKGSAANKAEKNSSSVIPK